MGMLVCAWVLGVGISQAPPGDPSGLRFQYEQTEMAVPVKLVFYAPDQDTANRAAQAVFQRFRQLNAILSDYDPDSELRRLCDTAGKGKAVPVSDELWRVLSHAQGLAERTDGAFDATVGPVVRVWRLVRQSKSMPPPQELIEFLKRTKSQVGFRLVRMDPQQRAVELTKRGMRLDFGGVAKGLALDEAICVLAKHGVHRAMVHAGGDIGLADPPPAKPGWVIGIAPREPDGPPSFSLSLSRCFVATSGDMWQYVVLGGKRYSHIVDPRTGLGLTDRCNVTVVAPNGMTADGLSTAVCVLGPEKGLPLIEQTQGAAAYVVRASQGETANWQSSRWKDLPTGTPAP